MENKIPDSPVEFMILGDMNGQDAVILRSETQQLDLMGFGAAIVLQDLPQEEIERYQVATGRQMNSVRSELIRPPSPTFDDRKSFYRLCWVGRCSDADRNEIRSLFDRSVADLQKSIADGDRERVAWSISPVIFRCAAADSKLKEASQTKSSGLLNVPFVQNAALVLFAALLAAFVALSAIDYYRYAVLGQGEARKARDAALLHKQERFLDEVSQTLLDYETLVLEVSLHKVRPANKPDAYRKTFNRYSEKANGFIAKWKGLTVRARTLAPQDVGDNMNNFLLRILKDQDEPTVKLDTDNAGEKQWSEQYNKNEEMLEAANLLINDIGGSLRRDFPR